MSLRTAILLNESRTNGFKKGFTQGIKRGLKLGVEQGTKQGLKVSAVIIEMLKDKKSPEKISEMLDVPINSVLRIKKVLKY